MIKKSFYLMVGFSFLIFLVSCASLDELRKEDVAEYEKISRKNIPVVINPQVASFIRYFQGPHRKHFTKWLERSGAHIEMMKNVFQEYHLPEDLVYLALIESGFNSYAYSRARATGIWQFMKFTGKRYGLKADWWVDERRDPVKSTYAAALYLKDLYNIFGSWYLAIPAYNAGEGKIMRAMKKYKTDNFWEMSKYRYLRRETKDYIPKFIAAMIIAKNPKEYGFDDLNYEDPWEVEEVTLSKPVDLRTVAQKLDISYDELKKLNPEIKQWSTPMNADSYTLRVPEGKRETLLAELDSLPKLTKMDFHQHKVRSGESLWVVSRAYGISIDQIQSVNNLKSKILRAGQVLMIPVKSDGEVVQQIRRKPLKRPQVTQVDNTQNKKKVTYTVNNGDTIWQISKQYNVSINDILAWNDINHRRIHPGDQLHIYLEGNNSLEILKD